MVSRRLSTVHAIENFGEALISLSLVGSLFLSVSLDASRSRILSYLLLTAAPLAIAAPLVGNLLDRTRIGYRVAISGSQFLQSIVALLLIGSLLSVALYPLAFALLICRKIYALAKTALLSRLTDDPAELLKADIHIVRIGSIAGGAGAVLGGVLLARGDEAQMLLIGSLSLLSGAFMCRGLPHQERPPASNAMPPLGELIPSRFWSATVAVTAIRAAAGALTYLLVFAIKRGGGDVWIFAGGLITAGAGGMLATLLVGRLHRRLDADAVLLLALAVPGLVSALGVLTVGNLSVLAIAFSIGLGGGVASREITLLYASVPSMARGRTIARSELLFQTATLVGACLAVQLAPSPKAGFTVSSLVLLMAAGFYASRRRASLRRQVTRVFMGDQALAVGEALPSALLAEAQRLAALGAYRMAVVVAELAVDIFIESRGGESGQQAEAWRALEDYVAFVRRTDDQPASERVIEVLITADRLLKSVRIDEHVAPVDKPPV